MDRKSKAFSKIQEELLEVTDICRYFVLRQIYIVDQDPPVDLKGSAGRT